MYVCVELHAKILILHVFDYRKVFYADIEAVNPAVKIIQDLLLLEFPSLLISNKRLSNTLSNENFSSKVVNICHDSFDRFLWQFCITISCTTFRITVKPINLEMLAGREAAVF